MSVKLAMFLFDYGDNITSYQADHISSELAGQALPSGCLCLDKQEYLTLHFTQKYFLKIKKYLQHAIISRVGPSKC